VNDHFIEETGKSFEALLGFGWQSCIHSRDLKRYRQACSKAEASRSLYSCELRILTKKAGYKWMRFVGKPQFEKDQLIGFIGSGIDIQSHKNDAIRFRKADRRKNDFLAILGHELRNPLSPIRNAAQTLRFIHSGHQLEDVRQTITRHVDHIARLIDDLLDVTRLARGTLTLRKEHIDVKDIIHAAADSTAELVKAQKQILTTVLKDERLFVHGDRVRLTQTLENLLTDAVKFTAEEGRIEVSSYRHGNEVVLAVKDEGIGIPKPMLKRIFELYTQEDRALKKSDSGLGIGLALVSQIISLHGGSVKAESAGKGQGSVFTVRLPFADVKRLDDPVSIEPPRSGPKRLWAARGY